MIDSIKKHHEAKIRCFPKDVKSGQEYIWIEPAFSIRKDPDNGQDYGNHGVEICFALRDGRKAVTVSFYTDYAPTPEMTREWQRMHSGFMTQQPTCTGLYYHRHTKKGASEYAHKSDDCLILGKCWGEAGSALHGEDISRMLIEGGSAAVFNEMRRALAEDFEEDHE